MCLQDVFRFTYYFFSFHNREITFIPARAVLNWRNRPSYPPARDAPLPSCEYNFPSLLSSTHHVLNILQMRPIL